jgi:hypothetical protein
MLEKRVARKIYQSNKNAEIAWSRDKQTITGQARMERKIVELVGGVIDT